MESEPILMYEAISAMENYVYGLIQIYSGLLLSRLAVDRKSGTNYCGFCMFHLVWHIQN